MIALADPSESLFLDSAPSAARLFWNQLTKVGAKTDAHFYRVQTNPPSDVRSGLQFIKSSIGLYKAKKFAFTPTSITSSFPDLRPTSSWLAFGRFDMGVEGESYRVRCADLFPPPSEGSIITSSPLRSPIFATTRRPLQSPLEQVIEVEIGPRLVLVHHECPVAPPDRRPTPEQCETLARLSIGDRRYGSFWVF